MEKVCSSSVFVVVPSYNEAGALRSTLESILSAGYEVICVDDGSTDETSSLIEHLKIHYLKHPINLGQGAALQTGMDYALRQQKMSLIAHFDADGQHAVSDIKTGIQIIQEKNLDLVMGSRFADKSKHSNVPFVRKIVLTIGRFVNWLFYGLWLSDSHNGFRILTRNAAEQIRLKENGSSHASEILGQIQNSKLRFEEVPIQIRYTDYSRRKGQSSWNAFTIFLDLILSKLS